ncbi:UDP-3-O-[3-hydroxymyristoyl] glucosamine N-acyltransferase [Mariniflexile fucanivorans]|uniref:UDP-3-O-[3-hydroxymyristoyl] glucosamine N-acyltransferase n=1 Tax=Mariniflexile fucanivorans TaxID=264023 RepID=A0A4R1RG69_9FLAO|nr:UDP-3-O-(3-hydroxymyristoyl)glucosamine N-acyltransferase [Mariniflexile fucanivorans]TCL64984.1 UDP-3-O-[3-hydroxymyristoyl] glucosamine N-acyltransferase [Mariniflexile fucanivorans]
MKFPIPYTLKQVAQLIDCNFVGNPDFSVLGMNEIHVVEAGDIVFVDHPKYYDKALNSAATIILINKEVACPEGKALLISDDPFRDFNKLTDFFKPFQVAISSISDSAVIGANSVIQPNAFIGHNVVIGENCIIHANVSIYDDTVIGNNVTIHSGTVLGANAFYYKKRPEGFDRLKSCGRVVIEDNVDIGANCTIDRGVTGDTTIKEGSKLDNLIQIGHDTVIGKRCLIASQVGIAGCVVVEDEVTFWGQVGCTSGVTIGEKAVLHAQAGISKSLEGHKTYWGIPAQDARIVMREMANIKQIPEILQFIKSKK